MQWCGLVLLLVVAVAVAVAVGVVVEVARVVFGRTTQSLVGVKIRRVVGAA